MAGAKRLVSRATALADVEHAVDGYLDRGGAELASAFVAALEKAYAHIARHPGTGSARWAHALNIPDLRTCHLTRFPHLVFYVERPQQIEVWRVLHEARDIPASLAAPDREDG